ncbi:MAG: nucleotidyl transferase AbiEii/AbiGii toxin family protein [Candidatus Tectomicrobia bacterium]|nr:nucleotidyl transferase AbiEii/AbiGii toxin family protein [Candidatus Tectomicrobia bacterium]
MAEVEPQYASDYDDRITVAVKSVLLEIGQILGSYKGKFAVIGGAVPWLLLNKADMPHIGTLDVDLSLDAEALGSGEYARLVESLVKRGYRRHERGSRFQLVRAAPARDGGPSIDVVVDFLMPRHAAIERNVPPLIADFAVQRADGADLALRFHELVAIEGEMPDGGRNRVQIAVASIPALLAMKGYALMNRLKQKDAYDIYYSIRNFPGGVDALVEATRPLLDVDSARTGYLHISEKFRDPEDFGPTSVRQFVDRPDMLGERTADQWQQDAFGQVHAWLSALGLR